MLNFLDLINCCRQQIPDCSHHDKILREQCRKSHSERLTWTADLMNSFRHFFSSSFGTATVRNTESWPGSMVLIIVLLPTCLKPLIQLFKACPYNHGCWKYSPLLKSHFAHITSGNYYFKQRLDTIHEGIQATKLFYEHFRISLLNLHPHPILQQYCYSGSSAENADLVSDDSFTPIHENYSIHPDLSPVPFKEDIHVYVDSSCSKPDNNLFSWYRL